MMRQRVRQRITAGVVMLVLPVTVGIGLTPGTAHAVSTCAFVVEDKRVSVEAYDDITVRRDAAGSIIVSRIGGPVLPCDAPTVTTVDDVVITSYGRPRIVEINLAGGRLTPGSETATADEIRITVRMTGADAEGVTVRVAGGPGVDTMTAGYWGINLDPTEDTNRDIDYLYERPAYARLEGRGGNDVLSGAGGDGTGPILEAGLVTNRVLVGGLGDDRLIGGGSRWSDLSYDDTPHGVHVDLAAKTASAMPGTSNSQIGTDTLEGISTVIGSMFDDRLRGDERANLLETVGGNDVLEGRGGDDELLATWGTTGATADYSGAPGPVTVHVNDGSNFAGGYSDGADGHDLLTRINSVRGSAFDDHLVISDVNELPPHDAGDGIDTVDLSGVPWGLVIDLKSGWTSSAPNVHQRLLNAERIIATPYADTIYGTEGANVISGGRGNDRIFGRGGDDTLAGDRGNDVIRPGFGSDRVYGGSGWDSVDYRERSVPVRVFLNGYANDGQDGEGDYVRTDVERVFGGSGDDTLGGNGYVNRLDGGPGRDRLYGGGGTDRLTGGTGADRLYGGSGADLFYARDSLRDRIDGGTGADTAYADRVDSCTSVTCRRG